MACAILVYSRCQSPRTHVRDVVLCVMSVVCGWDGFFSRRVGGLLGVVHFGDTRYAAMAGNSQRLKVLLALMVVEVAVKVSYSPI